MRYMRYLNSGVARLATFAVLFSAMAVDRAAAQGPSELFFSEYIEGSGDNKALEIFNGTGEVINLYGYTIQVFFNGSTTADLTIGFPINYQFGSNTVYVVAHTGANAAILAKANQTDGRVWFDGDDVVVLRKGTTVIDVIGQFGVDPGTEWRSKTTGTADSTLRRQASIFAGDADGTDAFAPAAQWDGFAVDTFDGLGAHAFVPQGGTPGYRCTPTDFRYVQDVAAADFKDRWDTRIGFTKDGKLTWSVDARWNHPSEGFVGKGSTTVTLDGLGLYTVPLSGGAGTLVDNDALQAAIGVEQNLEFPSIQFEPLNYGLYPRATGLINPTNLDVYQGCPLAPPKVLRFNVCSNQTLPPFGGPVAQPSVPRYPNRTFCSTFRFATVNVNGIDTPTVTDAPFSPVDFVTLGQGTRPGPVQLYGIRMKVVSGGSVELGDEQRLAELLRPMWDRRTDATARGLVFSKVVDQRLLDNGDVERTIVYLFQLGTGGPMTFISLWD